MIDRIHSFSSTALIFAARSIMAGLGRAVYLCATIALAVAAWLWLTTLASPFLTPELNAGKSLVIVTSANDGSMLPRQYADRVAAIAGVRYVTYADLIGVYCKPTVPGVSINAVGFISNKDPLSAYRVDKETIKRWNTDPLGLLIGSEIARSCGWAAGSGISPKGGDFFKPIAFHIIAVLPPQKNPEANYAAFAHYEYVNRTGFSMAGENRLFVIQASPSDPRNASILAARIESAFDHDNPPVAANTNADLQNGLARYGQAQAALGWVTLAVLLCAALVLVSVLAHAIAQRRAQMALLQVLGFSRGALWSSFALEAVFIVLIGAGIGIGAGLLVLHMLPRSMAEWFGNFAIPAWTWWGLPVWLAALLIAALAIPSLAIARLRPIDVRTT